MFLILKFSSALFNILLFAIYLTNVDSVPEDYCLGHLNISDCGLPPTPVFSYSKPGSRCEIETWRGCPSLNLFRTEYQCSDHCIGKLWRPTGEAELNAPVRQEEDTAKEVSDESEEEMIIGHTQLCDVPLNTSNCTAVEEQVFTFDAATRTCVSTPYYGCETNNKFDSKELCEEICDKKKKQWEHTINSLDKSELEKLQNLVDGVNKKPIHSHGLKLHVNSTTTATNPGSTIQTPQATEAENAVPTTTVTPAEETTGQTSVEDTTSTTTHLPTDFEEGVVIR